MDAIALLVVFIFGSRYVIEFLESLSEKWDNFKHSQLTPKHYKRHTLFTHKRRQPTRKARKRFSRNRWTK